MINAGTINNKVEAKILYNNAFVNFYYQTTKKTKKKHNQINVNNQKKNKLNKKNIKLTSFQQAPMHECTNYLAYVGTSTKYLVS